MLLSSVYFRESAVPFQDAVSRLSYAPRTALYRDWFCMGLTSDQRFESFESLQEDSQCNPPLSARSMDSE